MPGTFQQNVGEWGNATFPEGTPSSIVAHLRKEVNELAEKHPHLLSYLEY